MIKRLNKLKYGVDLDDSVESDELEDLSGLSSLDDEELFEMIKVNRLFVYYPIWILLHIHAIVDFMRAYVGWIRMLPTLKSKNDYRNWLEL